MAMVHKMGRDVHVGDVLLHRFLVLGFANAEPNCLGESRRLALNCWGECVSLPDHRTVGVFVANARSMVDTGGSKTAPAGNRGLTSPLVSADGRL